MRSKGNTSSNTFMLTIKTWKSTLISIFLILLLAIFLRTYNLFSIPIFADEAIYIRWSQIMKAEPVHRFLPLSDGKQPLFMWLTIPSLKFFSDPLIAGRIVSVAAGITGIIGIFLLSYRIFKSQKISVLTTLLYSISPFSVFFDRMALTDSLLNALGIWSLFFAVLTAQTMRLDFAMLTGFALGATWLTKSPGVFFLALLPSTILLAKWKGGPGSRLSHQRRASPSAGLVLRLFGLWTISWIIALGMYNILRLGPNFHMIELRNKDYIFTFQEVLKHPLDPFSIHIKEIISWFWTLLPGTVLLTSLLGVALNFKKYWREILLLSAWTILPLFVQSEFAKVFTARYILFTIPPVFVLASLGLNKLPRKIISPLIAIIVAIPLYLDYLLIMTPEKAPLPRRERSGYLEEWTSGTGIRDVAQFINAEHEKKPEEKIIVGTEGFFGTLPDGLQIYLADKQNIIVIGVGISMSDVNESLINAKKSNDRVFLVVNDSRLNAEPENIGLQLLKDYPKTIKPDGSRDRLLLLEVTDNAIQIYNIKNAKKPS